MKKIIIVLAMVLTAAICFAQTIGSAPTVSGVQMVQEGGIVRITYNLSYTNNPTYSHITLLISNDGGATFKISPRPEFLEGHFGVGVPHGDNKEIIWRIRAQYDVYGEQGLIGENFRARVIAKRDDNYDPDTYDPEDPESSVPAGMVFVQGTAGVTFNPGGLGFFTPATDYHVYLSPFYISQFEVTQAEWTSVMGGIYEPDWADWGQGPNHPAYRISWFDAIEYCNRRSIMEGLEPCYSYEDGDGHHGTNPENWPPGWNTNNNNHTNVSCNWSATGYRLPTEMEREYAARGGVPAATAEPVTFNHSWAGTDVQHQLGIYAWYSDNMIPPNGTKVVGTKLPNELGLYDMSGNIWNWVWDIMGDYPAGGHNNPTGPTSGGFRRLRGGFWYSGAPECAVSYRGSNYATAQSYNFGLRVARNAPPPPPPAGMVLVQGTAGVTFDPGGEGYFTPADNYNVSLSSFYISQLELTQAEWTSVMDGIYNPDWTDRGQGPNHPAYNISWFDAIEYCNRRSMLEGLEPCYSYEDGDGHHGNNPADWPAGWNTAWQNHTNVSCNWNGNGYRLPTEMEWEYAARGGVPAQNAGSFNDHWPGTDDEDEFGNYAWYRDNSAIEGVRQSHPVGTKLPNELSLYDMGGNVWNYVWDIYGVFPTGDHNNPTGPATGNGRALRGGSWSGGCHISSRSVNNAVLRTSNVGFRLSRTLNYYPR